MWQLLPKNCILPNKTTHLQTTPSLSVKLIDIKCVKLHQIKNIRADIRVHWAGLQLKGGHFASHYMTENARYDFDLIFL